MRRHDTTVERERGAVIVFFALFLVGMLTIAALAVDIGVVRARAGRNQSTADFAALAASNRLAIGDAAGACRDVVTYLAANARELAALDAGALCAQPGNDVSGTVCRQVGGMPQARPSQTIGDHTVTIHYPVPDTEIADGRGTSGADDGRPCERMRVLLTSREPAYFGTVLGKSSYTVTRSAVMRAASDPRTRIPALWLLDPTGCTSLAVSGGSQVVVGITSPELVPGVIMIDSDGSSCSSNQVTISATGAGTRIIAVPTNGEPAGVVSLHAMRTGATSCVAPACDPADVAGARLVPQPIGSGRTATRASVDWRYNCRSSYPDYHGVDIEPCGSDTPAYLDNLVATIGTSGSPGRTTEPGSTPYQRWTSAFSCNAAGAIVASGNWWVDCPGGLSIGNGTDVVFTDGNVVFDGGLSMTGGSLTINSANNRTLPSSCLPPAVVTPCTGTSSADAAFAYVRKGDWNITGGTIDVRHTFVHLVDGYLKVASATPSWSAPEVGPFTALSLWSEKTSSKFQINGGAGVNLTGIFFTPEAAPMSLSGGGDWGQLHAQFVSYHLTVSGGGRLLMAPDPRAVALPPSDRQLIR